MSLREVNTRFTDESFSVYFTSLPKSVPTLVTPVSSASRTIVILKKKRENSKIMSENDHEIDAAADAVAGVAAVAVKLPNFWKNDPVMWFSQAEVQFALANVVRDHTKFYHIIAKID